MANYDDDGGIIDMRLRNTASMADVLRFLTSIMDDTLQQGEATKPPTYADRIRAAGLLYKCLDGYFSAAYDDDLDFEFEHDYGD